jgi:hypothetical protein
LFFLDIQTCFETAGNTHTDTQQEEDRYQRSYTCITEIAKKGTVVMENQKNGLQGGKDIEELDQTKQPNTEK